jgi:hypothetical protein
MLSAVSIGGLKSAAQSTDAATHLPYKNKQKSAMQGLPLKIIIITLNNNNLVFSPCDILF